MPALERRRLENRSRWEGQEAREMRQSAWLKRLDCDATRPETAQSSSRSGAGSFHRTKQTIRNQMNLIPATRREMVRVIHSRLSVSSEVQGQELTLVFYSGFLGN